MNTFEFARKYFEEYKQHGNEIIPKYCPYCHGGENKDKYSFALNVDKQTFNCKRGSCAKQGHFSELCRDFGETADREEKYEFRQVKKPFVKPTTAVNPAKSKVENYLKLRGFSQKTWERRGVGEYQGNIAYPYYENGELVLMKFRKPEKYTGKGMKAWREEGGRAVLWGMDLCESDTDLVICEGEMDALALDECGVKNVLSVPSGAKDLSWIDNCWDWLKKYENIVFWGDNDDPGKEMVKKCTLRLSDWKCYVVDSKHKDANISLIRDGKEKTKEAVINAKLVPINGLIDLADVTKLDIEHIPRVRSGLVSLDREIGGFMMGELSVWTGKSGQGKSTLLGQILLDSIQDGANVCAYSGELRADCFQYWINLQAAGVENIKSYDDPVKQSEIAYVPKEINKKICDWYRGRFWLYDNDSNNDETGILKIFSYAAKRYDCKVFLVDNLMTSNFECKNENDYYRAQSNFVGELIHFAKSFGVHVHLVAHPKKTKGKLEKEDVSGTGDIANRAHNVFSVDRVEEEGSQVDSVLTILKNRFYGVQNVKIGLHFNKTSKRFFGKNGVENKKYGWEGQTEKHMTLEDFGKEIGGEF